MDLRARNPELNREVGLKTVDERAGLDADRMALENALRGVLALPERPNDA
jgi:hypothetical protein